jgi:two-component system, OmpR family, response regulator
MKILVVDDDKGVRRFLKKALTSECFEVDLAEDGESGLFLSLTNDYDLIILDYVLPKKNGKLVCEAIRSDGKKVPIIMLSAISEPLNKTEVLNCGADDYLTKPFSFEELVARIRAVLRRSSNILQQNLTIGNIEMDFTKQLVFLDGKEIYLTVKEFMILSLLARSEGSIVTRAYLLEKVWDMNADPFSNTVEVHISNLRKKIETNGYKIIKTIPGRGYRLSA